MSKKETTTSIALLGASDVPAMLEKVNEQIKNLKGTQPDAPLTDKEIPSFGKIDSITSVKNIIKAASSVLGRQKSYNEASKIVIPEGVKVPTFEVNGMSVKNIIEHLKLRAFEVYNKEKLKKLNNIKSTLESNLSAEAKLANDLKGIQSMLEEEVE